MQIASAGRTNSVGVPANGCTLVLLKASFSYRRRVKTSLGFGFFLSCSGTQLRARSHFSANVLSEEQNCRNKNTQIKQKRMENHAIILKTFKWVFFVLPDEVT